MNATAGAGMPAAGAVANAGGSGGMMPIAGMMPVAGASGGMSTGGAMAGSGGAGASGTGGATSGGSGGAAGAAGAIDGGAVLDAGPAEPDNPSLLPPVSDYAAAGPYDTTVEANVGPSGNYTIFRPEPLSDDGFLHPPIVFGPGILTTPSLYDTLLSHLASHGYVTICVNSLSGGPGSPGNVSAMEQGLDWLIAQNTEAGTYQGKLAIDRAVAMGYSLGSTASVQLSSHEAIATTVAIHGHNTSGDPRGPVLLLTGTSDVIDDVRDTLTTLEEAPSVLMALPIGHLDVLGELSDGGRYVAPITAWLRYWINGDDAAKSFFWGDGCEMCSPPWIAPEANAKWQMQTL